MIGYAYVATTVTLTVIGQLIIKWQVGKLGAFGGSGSDRLRFIGDMLTNPWVLLSLASAFVAALAWMAALSHLNLSRAYPFMSASFILVLALSAVFFAEHIGLPQVLGALLIVGGLVIGSQT
ncbi:MAG TPA: EamA family transporter [Thermoleophilaceae bacterium]|jgi:drug/metabolite transporter (DMT)-like permease